METGKEFVSELDERIFGKNTLSNILFKYFLVMGLLMAILPPSLNLIFAGFGAGHFFYYLLLPVLITLILLFFVGYVAKKILNPISELLQQVRKLQDGNLDVKLDMGGYVEIDSLVKSVDRMRNSLFIASSFLGERDKSRDDILKEEISSIGLYLLLLAPFLGYAISLTIVGGVLYSSGMNAVMNVAIPMWGIVQAVLMLIYGVIFAFAFGYILSKMLGSPMRKLAIAAEKASRGDMDADFSVEMLGEIKELSVRLNDLKRALKRAVKEMEGT